MPEQILEVLAFVWSYPGVQFITYHVAANLLVALAAALKLGEFDPARVWEFLTSKLAPFVMAYFGAAIFGEGAGLAWLAPVAFVAIEAALVQDLTDNLARLGLPVPDEVLGVALVKERTSEYFDVTDNGIVNKYDSKEISDVMFAIAESLQEHEE